MAIYLYALHVKTFIENKGNGDKKFQIKVEIIAKLVEAENSPRTCP